MKFSSFYGLTAFLGSLVLLAGCGGAQSPSTGGLAANSATGTTQHMQDGGSGNCQDGNMSVKPCPITLDSSNPGPVDVYLGHQGQGNRHRISETDNCASQGIATLTRIKNKHYTVAAGTTAGSCTAHFSAGGGQGNGVKLPITNAL
jgi:hypothetical protein